jgi:hypothetical protein
VPSHQKSPLSTLISGLRADLPCLTEFVGESRPVRIARFQADNADIYGSAQMRALGSITKAIRTKSARRSWCQLWNNRVLLSGKRFVADS